MNKKILFLVGYDYYNAIKKVENYFEIISPLKEAAFPSETQAKFISSFKERFHLVDYKGSSLLEKIETIKPDVIITLGWRRIIPDEVLRFKCEWINVHPAILPQYKGYHPVPFVLINEEKEHGITAHRITSELDGGDIILCKKFPINSFSTLNSLQNKVNELFPEFLVELCAILQDDSFETFENDSGLTKVIAKKRTPADSEIQGDMPFSKVYNFVRSCDINRFPAYFIKNGEKVFVKLSREIDQEKKENLFDL